MAKIEAFLTIEATTAEAMRADWRPYAKKVMDDLDEALSAGRWDDAYAVANAIRLHGVVENQRPRLEELSVSAMLFGASQLISPRQSAIMRGEGDHLDTVGRALDQLTIMVEDDGAEFIRDAVNALIAEEEDRQKDKLFKADQSPAAKLGARLNQAVIGTGKAVVDIGANLTTSRLVSYGFLAQATSMQITSYQVSEVLDSRICPVCAIMHGKRFQVATEISRVEQALRTLDPQELKSIAPWPSQRKDAVEKLSQMSEQELQTAGYGSPPYHPGCRGVLQRDGTVTQMVAQKIVEIKAPVKTKPDPDALHDLQETKVTSIFSDLDILNLIEQIADQAVREAAQQAYRDNAMSVLRQILIENGLLDEGSKLI